MNAVLKAQVNKAFDITGIESDVRCEALDSILETIVNALFRKGRRLSDFSSDLTAFGEDCNSGSLGYIRIPS